MAKEQQITASTQSPTLQALKAARGTGRRRVRRLAPAGHDCVIAYLRVSTEEQVASGLGLKAQEATIREECERRGLQLCAIYSDDGVSGTTPPEARPGLAKAITALDAGEASILMTAKIDRLGRSFHDLALLTPLAERAGWAIVALNCPLDTTTPTGKAMVRLMSVFAALERDLISERTSAALAVRKAQGAKLGHPSRVTDTARARLAELRSSGLSWPAVARTMNAEEIPSGSGVPAWTAATAQRLCPTTAQKSKR
jgi:DNA invertase Pin-like site-specific DNA recombinase